MCQLVANKGTFAVTVMGITLQKIVELKKTHKNNKKKRVKHCSNAVQSKLNDNSLTSEENFRTKTVYSKKVSILEKTNWRACYQLFLKQTSTLSKSDIRTQKKNSCLGKTNLFHKNCQQR